MLKESEIEMSKQIPLTQGKFATVDDEDYDWLMQYKWCARIVSSSQIWYACRKEKLNGKQHQQQMHRFITSAPPNMVVDHKNGDGLDNRRSNIRLATAKQNARNQRISKCNTSGYKGVSLGSDGKKFQARIRVNSRLIHLGTFDDLVEGAKAYNEAALKFFGEFASLNIIPE